MTAIAPTLERAPGRVPRLVFIVVVAAWALILAAQLSGKNHVLHNHHPVEGGPPLWITLLFFLFAWQAMVAAMMLPTNFPLIRLFEAASGKQAHASRAQCAFLAGYTTLDRFWRARLPR